MKIERQSGAVGGLSRLADDVETPAREGAGFGVDLAKATHQPRVRVSFGDQQIDIDNLGGVDDRPGHAAAQGSGGIDRWETTDVGPCAVGDVVLKGRDRVGAGAALIDRGGNAGMKPGVVRGQPEGGHPFEDMDVEVDPARCCNLAGKIDHLFGA